MSEKRKKKHLVAGILWMLLIGVLCHPAAAAETTSAPSPAVDGGQAETSSSEYTTPDITVEAKRPSWEEILSPGTVTIIRPEEFKGEQKSLPDFLKMVPGVHVREVNGKGQYTTVTVRGSTAAQVGVFVDGVLTNLGGDAAVDISTIPVSNVERIEVYRGYIPARFAGTFIGGVINIVTKKPTGAHGSAEIGPSSFGGKKASVEVTAP
ncbi:MAG: TonB-dependent receptor, partial [Selenomonas noxia]